MNLQRRVGLDVIKLLMIAIASLASYATAARGAEPATRPNIVLIISDDHAWNDYSFMGHSQIQTPRIDRLAAESLTFRRGYVPSSLCRASLMSIFTGLYPHQHRVTSNDPPLIAGKSQKESNASPELLAGRVAMSRFVRQVPTLAGLLRDRDYLSLQTGKWWEGSWSNGGFTHGMSRGERHGDDGLDIGRKTMQPINDFIDEAVRQKRPFLVWYAPMLPHTPHNPPARLAQKYQPLAPSDSIARYWACVEWFDETCGELLKAIDDRQLRENTIVVYIADNGWLQDPAADRYAERSKQSPYEGGIRTPIMIRWPGRVTPRMSDELAESIDLLPTLLRAVDAPDPSGLPGIDLLDETKVAARDTLFGECFTHNAVDIREPSRSLKYRWLIEGYWKLIAPDATNVPDGAVELYDLQADPWEKHNLAADRSKDVQRLGQKLDAWWRGP